MYLWYFFTVDYNKAPTTSHSSLISEKKLYFNVLGTFFGTEWREEKLDEWLISIVFAAY